MKARLIIKNFGPITDLDIEIKKYNILIGPQASGKSTIAKLLCVIHDYFKNPLQQEARNLNVLYPEKKLENIINKNESLSFFYEHLKNYRINSFYQANTFIQFEDDLIIFKIEKMNFSYEYRAVSVINGFVSSYYIPAERIALPMIHESIFQLITQQSSLPFYFLRFGNDFILSRNFYIEPEETFIPILNIDFKYKDGKNLITTENNHSLSLEESSSAIQATLPLLLMLKYPVRAASMLVIEELELHSFPKLQKQLLYHLIEKNKQQSLSNAYVVLPTHSPYILSAANNLLFANKVGNQSKETRLETNKIISEASWIAKEDFAAYYIDNGTAKSIVNEQTGLIDQNELDGISENLGEEFDLLMDLYKPAHA